MAFYQSYNYYGPLSLYFSPTFQSLQQQKYTPFFYAITPNNPDSLHNLISSYQHLSHQTQQASPQNVANLNNNVNSDIQLAQNEPDRHKDKPIIKYAKKNAESNIINQIFSFLSMRSKSERVLSKIFNRSTAKVNSFYKLMKQIKIGNKKYINRCYLRRLIEMDPTHIAYCLPRKIQQGQILSLQDTKRALRMLLNFYIRSVCVNTILTSSKLDKMSTLEHLQRRKQVYAFIQHYFKFQQMR